MIVIRKMRDEGQQRAHHVPFYKNQFNVYVQLKEAYLKYNAPKTIKIQITVTDQLTKRTQGHAADMLNFGEFWLMDELKNKNK